MLHKPKIPHVFLLIIILVINLFLSLSPMLECGYYSDDVFVSQMKGIVDYQDISLLDMSFKNIKTFIDTNGRFFPIWFLYSVPVFYFTNLFQYIIFKLFVVIIGILLFGYFIKLITGKKEIAFLSMIIIPVFFQFNIHGPILSYCALIPLVFCFIMVSLILLIKYIENKKIINLVFSVIAYTLSLFTYEITYLFFVFHFLIIIHMVKDIKTIVKYNSIYVASTLAPIIITVILRSDLEQNPNLRYAINYDIFLYLKALIYQISGSFPFLTVIYGFKNNILHVLNNIKLTDILAVISFGYIYLKTAKKKIDSSINKFILILGLAMIVLPGVIIATSSQLQGSISPGKGYIPVFIQYFGGLMFSIGALSFLFSNIKNKKIKSIFGKLLFLSIIIIALMNIQKNRLYIQKANLRYYYPRNILTEFIKSEKFEKIPPESIILFDRSNNELNRNKHGYPWGSWENKYFFYKHSNKKFNIYKTEEFINKYFNSGINNYKDVYYISYQSSKLNEGHVFAGKIVKDHFDNIRLMFHIKDWEHYRLPADSGFALTDQEDLLLNDSTKDDIYHIGFTNDTDKTCFRFPPLLLDKDFTVEIILKPEHIQHESAAIISNYPGYNNNEGFALIKTGGRDSKYSFGFGQNKKFLKNIVIELEAKEWHYLSILISRKDVKIYKDGNIAAHKKIIGKPKESLMPVSIGNSYNMDDPFNGTIKEIKISKKLLRENDIRNTWGKISNRLVLEK